MRLLHLTSKEIDDSALWLPSSKEELVGDLEAALTNRASVLLVGEPGVGKTCVLRALRHRLPQAVFRLLNHAWDSRALLSLVLVGLPELEGRMALRYHTSLLTRIHHCFLIEPATVDDTAEYLSFRLGRAGADHEIFSRESVAALHEVVSGSLREIDRLPSAALRETARRKRKLVDRDTIARVAESLTCPSN